MSATNFSSSSAPSSSSSPFLFSQELEEPIFYPCEPLVSTAPDSNPSPSSTSTANSSVTSVVSTFPQLESTVPWCFASSEDSFVPPSLAIATFQENTLGAQRLTFTFSNSSSPKREEADFLGSPRPACSPLAGSLSLFIPPSHNNHTSSSSSSSSSTATTSSVSSAAAAAASSSSSLSRGISFFLLEPARAPPALTPSSSSSLSSLEPCIGLLTDFNSNQVGASFDDDMGSETVLDDDLSVQFKSESDNYATTNHSTSNESESVTDTTTTITEHKAKLSVGVSSPNHTNFYEIDNTPLSNDIDDDNNRASESSEDADPLLPSSSEDNHTTTLAEEKATKSSNSKSNSKSKKNTTDPDAVYACGSIPLSSVPFANQLEPTQDKQPTLRFEIVHRAARTPLSMYQNRPQLPLTNQRRPRYLYLKVLPRVVMNYERFLFQLRNKQGALLGSVRPCKDFKSPTRIRLEMSKMMDGVNQDSDRHVLLYWEVLEFSNIQRTGTPLCRSLMSFYRLRESIGSKTKYIAKPAGRRRSALSSACWDKEQQKQIRTNQLLSKLNHEFADQDVVPLEKMKKNAT